MTGKLETPQDGWNAAMLYISRLCRRDKIAASKDAIQVAAFEEVAIQAEFLIDRPPVLE